MCEHSFCDAQCLSNAAHELLQILSDETGHACEQPLPWPETMEHAVRNSLSAASRVFAAGRFICSAIYTLMSNRLPVTRVPLAEVDFTINEMDTYCHTEAVYGVLSREMTTKLLTRCRREGVTVTSAVTSAIISAVASLVPIKDGQDTTITIMLSADTRRRCVPPVPNHDFTYHASGIAPFCLRASAVPKALEGSWQLAQTYNRHTNACVNSGQILGCAIIAGKACKMAMRPLNMSYMPTYGMSSWGVLPFVEQYGAWQLTTVAPFMNLLRSPFPTTIIQTVNGVLTLMFGGASPLISASVLTDLRDQCMNNLQQMVAD